MKSITVEVNKVALNRDDEKRIVKKDGISTLACGHKIRLELLSQVYITKLKSCKSFVTKLSESHNLSDVQFSLSNKCAYPVLVAS